MKDLVQRMESAVGDVGGRVGEVGRRVEEGVSAFPSEALKPSTANLIT